jgi:hypothetical protein
MQKGRAAGRDIRVQQRTGQIRDRGMSWAGDWGDGFDQGRQGVRVCGV